MSAYTDRHHWQICLENSFHLADTKKNYVYIFVFHVQTQTLAQIYKYMISVMVELEIKGKKHNICINVPVKITTVIFAWWKCIESEKMLHI